MDVMQYKLNYLYEAAMVPENKRNNIKLFVNGEDRDAFKKLATIQNNIVEFVSRGSTLYLHSSQSGNGKTSWAYKLLYSYFCNICGTCSLSCKALYIHVPTLLIALKDNITEKSEYISYIKNNINKCDLVIWDDIGNKTNTLYEADNLLSLVDSRMNYNKANIFTCNLNPMEMHKALGDRLASRICNSGYDIELIEGDKRGLN